MTACTVLMQLHMAGTERKEDCVFRVAQSTLSTDYS
jgi:hypothetical protein